jgi:hypothetical protein
MEDITSMAHDRLLISFVADVECEVAGGALGMSLRTTEKRDEILRRMDAATVRTDVKPDGHGV